MYNIYNAQTRPSLFCFLSERHVSYCRRRNKKSLGVPQRDYSSSRDYCSAIEDQEDGMSSKHSISKRPLITLCAHRSSSNSAQDTRISVGKSLLLRFVRIRDVQVQGIFYTMASSARRVSLNCAWTSACHRKWLKPLTKSSCQLREDSRSINSWN